MTDQANPQQPTALHRPPELIDQANRHRISSAGLGETLFVEAGAGTGKTTQLVTRIANLVIDQGVPLADIAAITFTEAAATELQTRIRVAFETRVAAEDTTEEVRSRCQEAIRDTDLAAISTVHGFASRILHQFPIAAQLPPKLSVLDEVSSQLAHEARWEKFVDGLHAEGHFNELVYRAALMDVPITARYLGQISFQEVAATFAQNWDRLPEVADTDLPPLGPLDFGPLDDALAALVALAQTCTNPDDARYQVITQSYIPEIQRIVDTEDPYRKLRTLSVIDKEKSKWGPGTRGSWKVFPCGQAEAKAILAGPKNAISQILAHVVQDVMTQLTVLTAREVLEAADARRRDGTLEFHDLLVLSRQLLRTRPEVRRLLHKRYRHILLDEFQDTDPIQIELASLIAAAPSDSQPTNWQDHEIPDGGLFFVGDPKQSIYRFRRADIQLFLAARDRYAGGESGSVALTSNFRTVPSIIDWVNGLFDEAMPTEEPGAQPRYSPLNPVRQPSDSADHRPTVFGGPHPDPKVKAAVLRQNEADDVAAILAAIGRQPDKFPVFDRNADEWRPARLSDVTILIPTRTSLPFLRDSLDDAGLAYRLATGTLVYSTQEVSDVMAVMRAVDDPTDALALVQALRSPLYGCSDVELFEFRALGNRWDLRATPRGGLPEDHPVIAGLTHLRSLWQERWWLGPSALLDRIVHDRMAFLLAVAAPRPAEVWRRLRFIIDQARSFEATQGINLRSFLAWAELQSADAARVHEPLLPETDEEAAQILTIHGSKGLEFPITILAGLTTELGRARQGVSVLWDGDSRPEIKMSTQLKTGGHTARADMEAGMDQHERLRLLYVAATRSRDHLFVSGHHKEGDTPDKRYSARIWQFCHSNPDLCQPLPASDDAQHASGLVSAGSSSPGAQPPSAAADSKARDQWLTARNRLITRAARPTAFSATAIARMADATVPDTDSDAESLEVEGPESSTGAEGADTGGRTIVRRKGRAGTAIGRALHGVLEFIDFADPEGLVPQVRRQCELEAITDHTDTVESLVRSILASPSITQAITHDHYKELYVSAPVGQSQAGNTTMVEGYIDLLIDTPEGLIVVDYKTDAAATPAEIDKKIDGYRLQGATYAVALEYMVAKPVIDCRFVFAKSGGAIERSITDLDQAKQEVRDLLDNIGLDNIGQSQTYPEAG